jgi:hypothetical protein
VQIAPQLGLSGTQEGLVGASALIGIFLGAFLGGWLTDKPRNGGGDRSLATALPQFSASR